MRDYLGYEDTVAVVTGAASGIGEATTKMLVDFGAKVYALDVAEVEVEGVEKFIETDLTSKDSIDQAFENLPDQFDSFFGIAGVSGHSTDFDTTMIINYVANKYISEEYLADRMKEEGAVNFVTSAAGLGWQYSIYTNSFCFTEFFY
jgi:NAD(P)-dependent dehydrogenase (short-subunit alcohol dehydrogenase family)